MLDKPVSLRGVVAALMDEDNINSEAAVETLVRRSRNEPYLRDALVLMGAKAAIRDHFHAARGEAYPIIGARVAARGAKVEQSKMTKAEREARAEAKTNRRQLIDSYALWGHTLLRDARKEDLRASIAYRQGQVAGNQRAIRFEEAILRRMTSEAKTCGECLSARKVDEIWMQHYGK